MSLPIIDNIRENQPNANIEVWCGRHSRSVYESYPGVAGIVEIPSVPRATDLPALIRRLRSSTNNGFIVLDRSRLIDLACKLARVDVLGTIRNVNGANDHETDVYLGALVQAGMRLSTNQPQIDVPEAAVKRALDLLQMPEGPFVVLHPGGAENPGVTMHTKRWPGQSWRHVVRWLEANHLQAVLTGSPDEEPLCREIAGESAVTIAAGKLSLMESAALISSAKAYVGPDTGLSHLAAATGAPTIAIFGPTNPRQYAPRGRCVTILSAPGASEIRATDLRRESSANLPSTAEVTTEAVIGALRQFVTRNTDEPW